MTSETDSEGKETVTIKLESGGEVKGDMVCWCTGQRPNSGFLKKYFANVLDDNERVKVRRPTSRDSKLIFYQILRTILLVILEFKL